MSIHEECGVFGVFSPEPSDVAGLAYYGLYALQHRGQESCGIAVGDDGIFVSKKDIGLVSEVFPPASLGDFPRGTMAVGHVRYATTGAGSRANCQPVEVNHIKGRMALAHNGNLANAAQLRRELELSGAIFHTTSDTETIAAVIILIFYLAVTVFSINKVIGTIYPVFGAALLIMAVLIGFGIFTHEGNIPSIAEAFSDHYPVSYTPLFPGLFITIACGAVSGFHATQSPMMARCIKNEKYGLRCFYGAMVTEGVVALIWAAAAMKFVDMLDIAGTTPYEKLYNAMTACGTVKMNPGILVERMCNDWLGNAGLVLAVLGIVAAPMSTGGSAFRAARMIVADFSHYDQKPLAKRLLLTAPLFAVAIAMLNVSSFKVLWLYVSWFNQVLATFTFFTIAHFLRHRTDGKGILPRSSWLIAYFPAVFMCAVSACFILIDKENGFGLDTTLGYAIGGIFTVIVAIVFVFKNLKRQ